MDYKEYMVYDNIIRVFEDNTIKKWGKKSRFSKVEWLDVGFYITQQPTNIYYWTHLKNKEGIKRKFYKHRLIYKAYHPEFDLLNKALIIDHISHTKAGDNIQNLRLVTQQQNVWNRQRPCKGYSKNKIQGTYQARITENKKRKSLGYYKTEEEAAEAYKEAVKLKLLQLFQ